MSTAITVRTPPPFYTKTATPDGFKIDFNLHEGQGKALTSERRFICVLAGTQSGKTVTGPLWLYNEIRRRGPGDYLVVSPTFQLLQRKALPEFKRLFQQWLKLGAYRASPTRQFVFTPQADIDTHGSHDPENPTTIYFGYAEDPESLESMTGKGAWLDEAGQKKFRRGSWEAVLRRMAIYQGRILFTTTPYDFGWLKQEIHDAWLKGDKDIQVVKFNSLMNPAFPKEEYDRARRTMPGWRFDMFYRGRFTRPAGMIYDSFNDKLHKVPRFPIPNDWPRMLGLDFGGVHTAGMFYALERSSGRVYAYREYLSGGRTAEGHAEALLAGEPMIPLCVGGSKSEGQWRAEFARAGLPVLEPDITEVEIGISRVWGGHKEGMIIVFDDLHQYLDQKGSYSRELDQDGQPTEEIADKSIYHLMDAERYILGYYFKATEESGAADDGQERAPLSGSGQVAYQPSHASGFHPPNRMAGHLL